MSNHNKDSLVIVTRVYKFRKATWKYIQIFKAIFLMISCSLHNPMASNEREHVMFVLKLFQLSSVSAEYEFMLVSKSTVCAFSDYTVTEKVLQIVW